MFQMEQKVKDVVTGFSGVATGRCEYLTGCTQYLVQPSTKKDGTWVDSKWFDETRLKAVSAKVMALVTRRDIGPDKPAPDQATAG